MNERAVRQTPVGSVARRARGPLSTRRVISGFAFALVVGPALSWVLSSTHTETTITVEVLAYQVLVVLVALIGGMWPAVFAAVVSGVTLDLLFVAPLYQVTIADPVHAVALVLYVAVAILVSAVVDRAARRLTAADLATTEAALLAGVAGSVLRGESGILALVSRTREAFHASGVRLLSRDGEPLATDGEPTPSGEVQLIDVGEDGRAVLEISGATLHPQDQRLLAAIVAQLAGSLENADLTEQARMAREREAADGVRAALLSAVSHDVRRPLAAAVAAIGGLRTAGPALAPADRAELLETASESLDALTTLVTDLLDVSRVQAGALAVRSADVDLASVVLASIDELGLAPDALTLDLDADVPTVYADGVLLQRAIVNLLANADRHRPHDTPVTISSRNLGQLTELRVIDQGTGIDDDKRESMFLPFQRHGDTDNNAGLGLGLALSRGFVEGMNGRIEAEDTPGGGLTMVVTLPATAAAAESTSS